MLVIFAIQEYVTKSSAGTSTGSSGISTEKCDVRSADLVHVPL